DEHDGKTKAPGHGPLADVDAPRRAVARFRNGDGEDAVFQIGDDARDVDRLGQREPARKRPVSALDAVVLLARDVVARFRAARAANHDARFLRVNLDLIARQPGQFGGQHVLRRGLVQIDRRRPAGRIGADEMAELFVQREQVAQRIPPGKRHVFHRSAKTATVAKNAKTPRRSIAGRMCYDCKDIQTPNMPSFLQATRLRKGHLIKVGNDLFRILELHHLTPGNKRAHIQVRMRNIRTNTLADQKFRAEEDVERATLDEREMQYLYND